MVGLRKRVSKVPRVTDLPMSARFTGWRRFHICITSCQHPAVQWLPPDVEALKTWGALKCGSSHPRLRLAFLLSILSSSHLHRELALTVHHLVFNCSS